MAKGYILSEADVILLREMAQERRRQVAQTLRPHEPNDDPTARTIYIARTPAGGIPALTEATGLSTLDKPGWASCDIYRRVGDGDDAALHQVGTLAKIVYNLSHERIGGNRWVSVARDEYGTWHVTGGGPSPFPSSTDTGTGTGAIEDFPPVYDDTGTGTNHTLTGGPGGVYYPCATVPLIETDVFCEPARVSILHAGGGLGTGTGTDTDNISGVYYLNLYKRTVLLGINAFTGCLERTALAWEYVRTIGCCEPECSAPDTGTGETTIPEDCCANGSLYETVGYTLNGSTSALCGACLLSGNLHQVTPPDGMVWTNSAGGSTCGGRAFLDLTLYCAGTSWRASGKLRTYLPGVEDITHTFDVPLTLFGIQTLIGTITITGCPNNNLSLQITLPCYHYECIDGDCVEAFGEADPDAADEYATVEECELGCEGDNPGTIATNCCVELIPATLTATFTNKTGQLVCLPDSIELTWDSLNEFWVSDGAALDGCAGCGGPQGGMTLECIGTDELDFSTNIFAVNTPTSGSCNPFVLTWTLATSNGGCGGTVTCTVTA